jgi:hypothetical protein
MTRSDYCWLPLLAQRATWERLGDHFSGERAQLNYANVLVIVLGAAIFAAVVVWLQRFASGAPARIAPNSPRRLFGDLCRAHRISRSGRRLLKRLAAKLQLPNAAMLFVAPDLFDAAELPAELRGQAGELEQLRERLFATGTRPGKTAG